jgi:hypothetical protein
LEIVASDVGSRKKVLEVTETARQNSENSKANPINSVNNERAG